MQNRSITALFSALAVLLVFNPAISQINNGGSDSSNTKYERGYLIDQRDRFIAENGNLPIGSFSVIGLEKTDESVILNETGTDTGSMLSTFDPHRLVNRLRKRNLFTDITVSYIKNDGRADIEISLREKWSIIPLPMFYNNGESTIYGLYILESNLAGFGKTLFAGGTYSEHGKTAMLGLIDPSIAGSRFAANLFITYKKEIIENGTPDKDLYSRYLETQKMFRLDAGYNFTDHIKLLGSAGYHDGIMHTEYSGTFNNPESGRYIMSGLLTRIDLLRYYEYFFYGLKCDIDSYTNIPDRESSSYHTLKYQLNYAYKIFDYHRLTLFSSGGAGQRPGAFEERISGKNGTRTLPAEIIAADNYINYSIIYEYPFLKLEPGAMTLLLFWEQGAYNRDSLDFYSYRGPGAGVVFYLKRVAFPAFGFNYAKNLKTGFNEFSVNIGYMF